VLVAKTKGPEEWKAVTSAISTLVEEVTLLEIMHNTRRICGRREE